MDKFKDNETLQEAITIREDRQYDFDVYLSDVKGEVSRHTQSVIRGDLQGIPPEAKEHVAKLLALRCGIEDAEAQISRALGSEAVARYHEDRGVYLEEIAKKMKNPDC